MQEQNEAIPKPPSCRSPEVSSRAGTFLPALESCLFLTALWPWQQQSFLVNTSCRKPKQSFLHNTPYYLLLGYYYTTRSHLSISDLS
jgi:hypothetical protein